MRKWKPERYILEEWDSMCAKANKSLHSDCALLEDEVLVKMHQYVSSFSEWQPIDIYEYHTCGSCIFFNGEECTGKFEGREKYSDSIACDEYDDGEE